tara:strand:- start:220 stop:894 length:675 start_codon:yes stop_codon:yes gene_type:complete
MGASKKIMEMFLMNISNDINISTARFANVAFSDGSLLHGFNQRLLKNQPIVAPNDISRYFVTPKESGELCLLSCIFGYNRDIYFPKLEESLHAQKFSDIAINFLKKNGLSPAYCDDEEEARNFNFNKNKNLWPILLSSSDTTGEKEIEEFYTLDETIDFSQYNSIGVVKNELHQNDHKLNQFEIDLEELYVNGQWTKKDLVKIFNNILENFNYEDKGKYLDSKM